MADLLLDAKILTNVVASAESLTEDVRALEQAIVDLTQPLWREGGEVGKDYGPGLQAFVQVGTRRDPFTMEVPREPIVEILRDALGKMIEKRDAAIAVVQRAAAATRGES